jgi:hypothetical protein
MGAQVFLQRRTGVSITFFLHQLADLAKLRVHIQNRLSLAGFSG